MEPGTKLGPYEITEQLGAGGMGEVYLAQDTRLGRKVAIKVLPAEFASDPERLARFEQEARAAAALNHPHIAVVHDIGTEGDTHFMVQEYLEGDTLREPLGKGALPLKKALGLATEIAEALAAAHAAGIIHRDLKPENIFVTKEGHAKVLDFGLAKLTEVAAGSPGGATQSPTMMGTVAGQVMGTAGYMAPEQVEGSDKIDHRADLFAFGCLLYEMVTGRQAFGGKNVHETLAHILSDEPPAIGEIDRSLPIELQRIVRKALAKEPAKRYQTAGDLVVDIQALGTDVESGAALPTPPVAVETTRGISWKLGVPIAVASALLAVLATWWAMQPEPGNTIRLQLDPLVDTILSGPGSAVVLSPDGRRVAYVEGDPDGGSTLYLRALDQQDSTTLASSATILGAPYHPFFSPDGQWVGFVTISELKKASVTGGTPQSIAPVDRSRGADWGPDDTIVFTPNVNSGLFLVSAVEGEPGLLTELSEGERSHRWPQFLPGGKAVLFTSTETGGFDRANLEVVDLETGERQVVHQGGTYGRYVPTGHLVYSNAGALFAVPFDLDTLETTGSPIPVVENLAADVEGGVSFDFSETGMLVYHMRNGGASGSSLLVWVDRDGQVEPLPFEPRRSQYLGLSPDDQRIALQIQGNDGDWDIWIYEIERGGSQVLLNTEGNNEVPVWSPDGQWVFFRSDRGGNNDIFKRRADRSLDAELVLDTEADVYPISISDDGEMLLFGSGPENQIDLGILALDTGDTEIHVDTAASEFWASFSPDGRFFAFHSDETGQFEVYVREVSSGRTFPVSTSTRGGWWPRWSRDGREIYYESWNSPGILVAEVDLESFSASDPVEVSDIVMQALSNFDVTADGQRFLVTVPAGSDETGGAAPSTRLNVVLNWFEELNRLVPTGGS